MGKRPCIIFTIIIIPLLILASFSTPVIAVTTPMQNPTPAIIAQKLDAVARQKGIPSVIFKAIAFKESGWRQWNSQGKPLISVITNPGANPAIGIMQIASYNALDPVIVEKLKNDIDFNIFFGADLLNEKFLKITPQIGDGDRNKLENWYFAIWAYNSWSMKNNPWQAAPDQTYQDKVIELCGTSYVLGYVTQVNISKIPVARIPQNQLPNATNGPDGHWDTVQPVHLGDLGTPPNPLRIAGVDRMDTAIQIALNGWPKGSETVIISRSDDFPDALAGVPLAHKNDAPILLTSPRSLDNRVQVALKSLHPSRVILLGGEGALSSEINTSLAQLGWTGEKVTRLGGRDRFETAALIAKTFAQGTPVALATGLDFPDALSMAPAAASQNFPILLTDKVALPEATADALKALHPSRLISVGGESVISESVLRSALQAAGLSSVNGQRLAGKDRYETSAVIAKTYFIQSTGLDIATGENFPDALAGAAMTAHHEGALLLISPQDAMSSLTQSFLQSIQKGLTNWNIFGGEKVLPNSTILEIQKVLTSE
ncbi:MAG: cell wall-binding repeat-containing protein [Desulfitobacteriaceae bacterium]